VLTSVQRFSVPELDVERRFWAVALRGIVVNIARHREIAMDERLVRTTSFGRPVGKRLVGVSIEGAGVLRRADGAVTTTRPGTIYVMPGRGAYVGRVGTRGYSFNVEIDPAIHGGTPGYAQGSLSARGLERARGAVEMLTSGIEAAHASLEGRPALVRALDGVFDVLRAEGFELPRAAEADADFHVLRPLARAIDHALSQTGSRPMLVDLEGAHGTSARTIQRWLPAYFRAWGQTPESFRDHARRIQLGRACWLMTHPRATTEGTSRVLGFARPSALCKAMAEYGLPSPGSVRDRIRLCA
jgi:hypothetical protein